MVKDTRPPRADSPLSFRSLVERVIEAWLNDVDLSEQTVRRLIEVSERFVSFVEGVGESNDGTTQDFADLSPIRQRASVN